MSTSADLPLLEPCDVVAMGADVIVVDTRPVEAWHAGHAPGAVHVPHAYVIAGWSGADARLPFAVVCTDGSQSPTAAAALNERGRDVYVVRGGMRAWHDHGHWIVTNQPGRYPTIA